MTKRHAARRWLAAGASVLALAAAAPARADEADQNARIARLEAAVASLTRLVEERTAANETERADNAQLRTRIAELEAQIEDMHAQSAAQIADVRSLATATPVTIANGRPTIASADGQFSAAFRGVFQLDAAQYNQDAPGSLATDFRRGSVGDANENERARDLNDGTNFRRARLGVEGRAFGIFEYNFLYDFGGSGIEEAGKISAAWVQWNASPTLRFRAGAFSPPAGMEEAASTNGSLFLERASPSELVRSIASGDGRVAAGVFHNGERWQYSAAISGNTTASQQTYDEQLAFVGRASYVPYRRTDSMLHIGANVSWVINPPATGPNVPPGVASPLRLRERPEIRVDATRLVDTGNIDSEGLLAIGGELAFQRGPFSIQAEYFDIRVERRASALSDPNFNGWYVQAAWTLTGEPRRYTVASGTFDSPRPARPFSPREGHWGAFELAARYSDLDLNYNEGDPGTAPLADSIRGGQQRIVTLGVNWHLNNNVKLMADFQAVDVDRLSPGGAAFGAAPATPPAGAQIGQDFTIWSLRTQYAF